MSTKMEEVQRRTQVALEAIRAAFESEADDFGATLFVSHHLEELDAEEWQSIAGSKNPSAQQVLGLLQLRCHWGDEDDEGIDVFDFTLPGGVTQYVLSVRFDEAGNVREISMES